MSNKLRNVQAVRDLLAGKHKTQTRKTFGFTSDKVVADEVLEVFKEGESKKYPAGRKKVWLETNPISGVKTKCTQKEGFVIRESESASIYKKAIKELLTAPDKCPKCDGDMKNEEKRLNMKFYFLRGCCYSCVLRDETKIRLKGPEAWAEYQKQIMRENATSFFRDADKEVDILKSSLKEVIWGNAQGEFGEADVSDYIQRVSSEYEEFKKTILENLSEQTEKTNSDN